MTYLPLTSSSHRRSPLRPSTGRASVFVLALAGLAASACGDASKGDTSTATAATALVATARPVTIQPRYGTVRLPRSEHPLARPEFDVGRLDPEKRISNLSLFFRLSPAQRADRDALVAAQLDRTSPAYHQWLTPESYQARFGARAEDVARATAWLAAQGLEVHETSPLGTRVSFSGKVSALESAFQTEMHTYRVGAETHYAMATAPALPEDLAAVVEGVHNTHDFFKKPVSRLTNAAAFERRVASTGKYEVNFDGGPPGGFKVLGPPDWAAAYDVAKLYSPGIAGQALDGTGITIGIVGTAAVAQSDIDAFRKTFNLPPTTVKMTLVPNTGASAGGQGGGGIEAILDLEWSGGIAKGATINYVYVGQDDGNVDDATFYLIEHNLTPLMSESYGGCEAGLVPSEADILETNAAAANLLGITYMASSGDAGAADCVSQGFPGLYVDLPGAYPGVTSVGGTQFPTPGWDMSGNLDAYPALEQVWNESNDPYSKYGVGAGGGGLSIVYSRPAYQAAVPACEPLGSIPLPSTTPMRQVPDVSFSAASGTPGYWVECTFDNATQDCAATGGDVFGTPIGGTSASSPSFAGVVAILNQAVGERLGNINPILYHLEANPPSAAPFHDITSGNNEIACGRAGADAGQPEGGKWPDAGCAADGLYGYTALPGYDCASGIGSVDAFNLVSAWLAAVKTDTTLTAAPTMTSEGTPITLTAAVNVDGVNANPVTGVVTYVFKTYTQNGQIDLSWELGTVAIANGTATGGQAVLSTTVPPGLVKPGAQTADVFAFYGGDANHLASQSAKLTLTFAPLTIAIAPESLQLNTYAHETFTASGGTPPYTWYIGTDTTGYSGSSVDPKTGAFVGGGAAGYSEVVVLDSFGAEALAEVTVGSPTGVPPWPVDGGVDAAVEAGVDTGFDAGHDSGSAVFDAGNDATADAGKDSGAGGNDAGARDASASDASVEASSDASDVTGPTGGGCSCDVAAGHTERGRSLPPGALGGVGLGVAAIVRRRRSRG